MALEPEDPLYQYVLGVSLVNTGQHNEAIPVYAALLRMAPNWASAYHEYGRLFYESGQGSEAVATFRIALHLNKDYVKSLDLNSQIMFQAGYLDEALKNGNQALSLQPNDAGMLNACAVYLKSKGEKDQALELLEKAVRSTDDIDKKKTALMNISSIMREQGKRADAITVYEQVLQLDAHSSPALVGIGITLVELSRYQEGLQWIEKGLVINPLSPEGHAGKAVACAGLGEPHEAVKWSRKAVEINVNYADGYNNLGLLQVEIDEREEARNNYNKALEINPDYLEARFNIGLLDLVEGDLANGWEGYAMRWEASTLKGHKPIYPVPEWDGRADIRGKRLLLFTEQGFGDSIQFIRYIPLLAERGAEIILHCQPELLTLFTQVEGVSEVREKDLNAPPVTHGDGLPKLDYYQALLTLPQLMETSVATVPMNVPYLCGNSRKQIQLPAADTDKLKVAVTWCSNLANVKLTKRNLTFDMIAPILDVEGVQFYNLQMKEPKAQAGQAFADGKIIDITTMLSDFSDTSSMLEQLDLVISVDTGLVHLCGSMGLPVWVMMPFTADWRWLLYTSKTNWYPSMTIYRQSFPYQWDDVFSRIIADLQVRVAEHQRAQA